MSSLRAGLPLSMLALALAGCVAGPSPSPTPDMVSLPDQFTFAPDEAARLAGSLDALLPDDPAFDALHEAARDRAPNLGVALARIEVARADAAAARARRAPAVDYSASVTASRTNPDQVGSALPFAIDNERIAYEAGVAARWDPDLFGVLKASERSARWRLDAAGAEAAAVRLALASEIGAAVIDWRTLSAREASLGKDIDAARELARLAGVREKAGIAPGFDRVRAETQAAASEARLAALESERARIVGRLVTLTGLAGTEVIEALALPPNGMALPSPPDALPSQLIAARPDLRAAAARLAAADANVAAVAALRFPRFDLRAGLGLLAFALGDVFSSDAIVGQFGAGIAGPLLDFGRIEADIDRAEAQTGLAFAQYRQALFRALGESESAYGLIAAADREAEAANKEWRMAERSAALAETRYRAGLENFITVLEARRGADASGERAAIALGSARRARLLLWQALGGDEGVRDAPGKPSG